MTSAFSALHQHSLVEGEARAASNTARDRYAAIRRSTSGEPIVVEPCIRVVRIPTTPTATDGPSSGYFGQQLDADVQSMAQSMPASPGAVVRTCACGRAGCGAARERAYARAR